MLRGCKNLRGIFTAFAFKLGISGIMFGGAPIGVVIYQLRNTMLEDMKMILPATDESAKRLRIFHEK